MIFGLALFVIVGFGALAIDISWMRMCQSQAQDVADAATQAALLGLRRSGNPDVGARLAKRVVDKNPVGGRPATIEELVFGTWDDAGAEGTFTGNTGSPNAVKVRVSRTGDNSVAHLLAPVFGYQEFDVGAEAISATRNLHVVLVMDITNSWSPRDFFQARAAAVRFLDVLRSSPGPYDRVGMSIFTNRYGWEFTPFTHLRDGASVEASRDQWSEMKTASKAGESHNWPWDNCDLNYNNDFSDPPGGCYPNMPREYTDEPGTDHTTGMEMAALMFEEEPDPNAYRAMVVLTDGKPNGISSSSGSIREAQGYTEPWRQYTGPAPHSESDIEWDSVQLTADLWATQRVHTWVVSFVADDWFMAEMPRGAGYYVRTYDRDALVPIFEDIANSLPLAVVK